MSDNFKSYLSQIAGYQFLLMIALDFFNLFELSPTGWTLCTGYLMVYAGGRKVNQAVQSFRGQQ